MKKAVIFDLFETLVEFSSAEYSAVIAGMARCIGKEPEQFVAAWHEAWPKREIGEFENVSDYITALAGPVEQQVDLSAAVAMHWSYERQLLNPYPDTVTTLKYLKNAGYKTAVITNCPVETASLWRQSRLSRLIDVAVFSFMEKTRKPDPAIYEICLQRLELEAKECIYVGDGANDELESAFALGMYAIRIGRNGTPASDEKWRGPAICNLSDLIKHLKAMAGRI